MQGLDLRPLRAALALLALLLSGARAEEARLVVFTSQDPVAARWEAEHGAFLEQLARDEGLTLQRVDVAERGAPSEVAITPLLVLENHRGRSVYQGRSNDRPRILNFVRTSRIVPQSPEPWVREDVSVLRLGRARVALALKVTGLEGSVPDGLDPAAFEREARAAIAAGFERAQLRREVRLGRADRTFYLDLYPYRDAEDRLFVSLALFSQFHCKEPVFVGEAPVSGAWSERADVFARAARALEAAVLRVVARAGDGDAFSPVAADLASPTWEELGFGPLPAPEARGALAEPPTLGTAWNVVTRSAAGPPPVTFRFPPPLDGTAGRADGVRGALRLGEGLALDTARGELLVDVATVTLGSPDLDSVVRGVTILDAKAHPEARFTLEGLVSSEGRIAFGSQVPARVRGTFAMRGVEVELEVATLWEPIVTETGEARLLVEGAFELRLFEAFGIRGPDGPEPQRDTLLFRFDLELAPDAS